MRPVSPCLSLLMLTMACGCAAGRGQLANTFTTEYESSELVGSSTDPWISAVAEEGRSGQHRESEPDPLNIRDVFTSTQAREIEHNLGID